MNIYEKQQCERIINNAKVKAGIKGSKNFFIQYYEKYGN